MESSSLQPAHDGLLVRAHYDRISRSYNRALGNSAGRGPDGRFRRLMALFPRELLHSDQPVLEIGCGTGLYSRYLRSRFGVRYRGCDLSPGMLRVARDGGIAPLAAADALRLPFADGAACAVFAFGVLHHIPDTPRVLGEIARVLRPDGALLVMEPNRLNPGNIALGLLRPIERGMLAAHRRRWRREAHSAGLVLTGWRRGAFLPSWPEALSKVYDAAERVLEMTPVLREFAIFDLMAYRKIAS